MTLIHAEVENRDRNSSDANRFDIIGWNSMIFREQSIARKQVPSAIALDGVTSKWQNLQDLRFELIYLKKERSRCVR
ncbi:hypothetical protein [Microcoleus sp. D3_18a_C4]|uniref:hypothetical protein n=1 Tax=unclassified Microcoleus TaxID=2642155 RepID=UPI002FD2B691